MDNIFSLFFTAELSIRFLAFVNKHDAFRDSWFIFDFFLFVPMVVGTWLLPIVGVLGGIDKFAQNHMFELMQILQLSGLARLARIVHYLPGLRALTHGLFLACLAVLPSLIIVCLLIYIFAILLVVTLKDYHEEGIHEEFHSIRWAMWTLLIDGTIADSPGERMFPLLKEAEFKSGVAVFIFIVFVLLSAITLMNMIIGIICEVVNSKTVQERDDDAIDALKKNVLVELQKFDVNGNNKISKAELAQVMEDKEALSVLNDFGIDLVYLSNLQEMLFDNPAAEVSIERIMELMLSSRKDLPSMFKHLAEGQMFARWAINAALEKWETRLLKEIVTHFEQLLMHRAEERPNSRIIV